MNRHARPKRRFRCQFRLRSLLLGICLLGPLSGCVSTYFRVVFIEWDVIDRMRGVETTVKSDFFDRYGLYPPTRTNGATSTLERWLSRPAALVFFTGQRHRRKAEVASAELPSVKSLRLVGDGTTCQLPMDVGCLPHVEEIHLLSQPVDEDTLDAISRRPQLRVLALCSVPVSDDNLLALTRMRQLRELHLYDTRISENGFLTLENSLPHPHVYPSRAERQQQQPSPSPSGRGPG